ncbi:MAG: HD domain-containing protein [Ruminococcus sp.]|nr:HD domain-containing protein [Ruminococcus sp.]
MGDKPAVKKQQPYYVIGLCVVSFLMNMLGAFICEKFGLDLYLDTVGTVLAAVCGGYIPGILVAFCTTFIKGISDHEALYYSLCGMLVGVCGAYFSKHKFFNSFFKTVATIPIFTLVAVIPDSILTWYLYPESQTTFGAQLSSDFRIELADKSITVIIVFLIFTLLPKTLLKKFRYQVLYQAPLTPEMEKAVRKNRPRSVSINIKIALILTLASFLIAGSSTIISFVLYRDATIHDHESIATGVAEVAASNIDADMVDEYIAKGDAAEGYGEVEKRLYMLRSSHADILYIYAYKIEEDGCHVVFDLDTDEVEGSEAGDVIPFDDSFSALVPDLLAGKPIDPIITDDSYGWLMTVYKPVYNDSGECVCYAAADISMNDIVDYQNRFIAKLLALFIGFFIIIIAVSLWFVRSNLLTPVNTIAYSAGAFAFNSDGALGESVERLRGLDIRTGDEIENLYLAFLKTTEDSVRYVEDIKEKTETISKMQNGLIMVLADLVESRDKCTGDHVRKTAEYARIIMTEMKKRGMYPDQLTDEFINDVMNAAPLHDVGKIHVSDMILNKPARLTDEEFAIMRTHTTLGSKIIDRALDMVPDSAYLREAKNLSEYHHEKWNGKGYPHGLSGEDIPLSARIMAVADVFDALVSRRSYKEPFTFEKAMDIIRTDAGTHFDPLVAEAFLGAEDEVRKVAESFSKAEPAAKE